jgi:citrate lyase subunit beta/citryl-CoA lyase
MRPSLLTSSSGKKGACLRSDCYIEAAHKTKGGIKLDIKSKVSVMYGENIRELITDILSFYSIKNIDIEIQDSGALPFTIAARMEYLIKQIYPDLNDDYLLPFNPKNRYKTTKDRQRRSRLYLPGNEPKYFPNAGLHKPDAIILDLEDSVAPSDKAAARYIVRNALRSVNFYGAERMVRINQGLSGINDILYIARCNPHVILLPKCESSEEIQKIEMLLTEHPCKPLRNKSLFLMPIIESAKGVINAYEIATSSELICALAIGLEDYTADIGIARTSDDKETYYARAHIVNAAKAAALQAIDTVFSDVSDMQALRLSALSAKAMGFEGKGCIHPRQIAVVNEAFAPTKEEIEKAKIIIAAYEEGIINGSGVVAIGSKMIDAPVLKRAQRIVKYAMKNNTNMSLLRSS